MECMRALVAKDRLVEGCWTAYNASLERSILKKAKYLEVEPAVPAPPAAPTQPAPPPEPETRAEPAPRTHASQNNTPQTHAPKTQAPLPQAAGSLFAEKLEQAWRKGS
jgi:hypothetical protein